MSQRYRPACMWCGHVFHPYEYAHDHFLWCGGRPADAVAATPPTNTKEAP